MTPRSLQWHSSVLSGVSRCAAVTRRDRLVLASPFAATAALRALPVSDDGPTICPVALFTGVACPGCGMLRAVSHLVRGDVTTALTYHPLVFLIVAAGVITFAWFLLRRLGRVRPIPARLVNAALATTAVLLVGVWATRLTAGTLPAV